MPKRLDSVDFLYNIVQRKIEILLDKIKENIAYYWLRKKLSKENRNTCFHNYNTAKSIVLLFDASKQEDYKEVYSFFNKLSKTGMRVQMVGFNYSKDLFDFYQTGVYFSYFSKQDFHWYGGIKNPKLNDFLQEEWDILIDFGINNNRYFINAIAALSKAQFKIATKKHSTTIYDFIIDIEKNKNLTYFIEQIDFYLKMINKK